MRFVSTKTLGLGAGGGLRRRTQRSKVVSLAVTKLSLLFTADGDAGHKQSHKGVRTIAAFGGGDRAGLRWL